ncbi:MAG: hypothetical protein ACOCXH_10840 [Cyclobacteriaceae bacterium]
MSRIRCATKYIGAITLHAIKAITVFGHITTPTLHGQTKGIVILQAADPGFFITTSSGIAIAYYRQYIAQVVAQLIHFALPDALTRFRAAGVLAQAAAAVDGLLGQFGIFIDPHHIAAGIAQVMGGSDSTATGYCFAYPVAGIAI